MSVVMNRILDLYPLQPGIMWYIPTRRVGEYEKGW